MKARIFVVFSFLFLAIVPAVLAQCSGACGLRSSAVCWCDTFCVQYGDCCADFSAECPLGFLVGSCMADEIPIPEVANDCENLGLQADSGLVTRQMNRLRQCSIDPGSCSEPVVFNLYALPVETRGLTESCHPDVTSEPLPVTGRVEVWKKETGNQATVYVILQALPNRVYRIDTRLTNQDGCYGWFASETGLQTDATGLGVFGIDTIYYPGDTHSIQLYHEEAAGVLVFTTGELVL